MTALQLGGIVLSDGSGKILNNAFLINPDPGQTRTTSFRGDEKLFVGVLASTAAQTVLLEVQNGQVSYSNTPGQITIRGKFYATQPSTLSQGERFIYEGSIVLPIKTIKDEDRIKGYEIASQESASVNKSATEPYLEPKSIIFKSGDSQQKPSLTVQGELVPAMSEIPYQQIVQEALSNLLGDGDYTLSYSESGKNVVKKPILNIGNFELPVPLLPDYKLEAKNVDLQIGPFDSQWVVRLGGEYSIKSKDKKKVDGKLKIVTPDNFFQFGGGGTRFKGSFELNNLPIPPVFVIKKASAKVDTKNLSTYELSASAGLAFNLLESFGNSRDEDPLKSFGMTVGVLKGKLDTLIIDVKGIKYPLGLTGYVLTGLGGGIKDLAKEDKPTKVVLKTSFESTAKLFDKPNSKGDVDGEFSLENLGIFGKLEFFPGFSIKPAGIDGFAKLDGRLVLDWNKGNIAGGSKVNIMSDFLTGRIDFAADSKFNMGLIGEMNANIPRPIPLIGGKNLGQVGAGFQYINDNTFSNDFAAAWFGVNLLFIRKQFGAKVVFDGTFKTLGADGIAETKGILDGTIGAIAKGDLNKAISKEHFLPVRFDKSQFDFYNRSGIFEPIAMSSGFKPFGSNTVYFSFGGSLSTKNGQEYSLPDGAVFLSDVATVIPELSTQESVFYVVNLDLFKKKTGKEFSGFAKLSPRSASIERYFAPVGPDARGVFPLSGELFKITDAPDVTIKSIKSTTENVRTSNSLLASSVSILTVNGDTEVKRVDEEFDQDSEATMLSVNRGTEVEIAYEGFDPDSEATITFYYDTDGVEANGVLIATGVKEQDSLATYAWDTKDVPTGIYYVYAVIDDGNNVPVVSYLPNPIRIYDPEVLPQVQGVTAQWSGDDSVELTWEPSPDLGFGYYVVSYTKIASGDRNEEEEAGTFEITEDSRLRLTGLQPGEYYRFTVKAVNELGQEGLPSEPTAVLVGYDYTARLEMEEWEFSTYPGSTYSADLFLNEDQQAVLLKGPPGAVIEQGQFIWDVPIDANRGLHEVSIQIVDAFGNESVLDRSLQVSDRERASGLIQTSNSIFELQGTSAKLEVMAISPSTSEFVNELGVFSVDDAEGRIDGLEPDAPGYLEAAVKRAKSVFSVLVDNPPGFHENLNHRLLSVADDTHVRFLLVKDGTLDGVRDGQIPFSSILLPTADNNIVTQEGNSKFRLQWEDGTGNPSDFQDLVVQIQATDQSLPLAGDRQKQTTEIFDFTDVVTPSKKIAVDLTIYQSPAFENVLGFYEILNTEGSILDTLTNQVLQPGDPGYDTVAVRQRVASMDVIVNGETDAQGLVNVQSEFSAGKQFAPFVIVNGRPEQLSDTSFDKDPEVYFPYVRSNTDAFDRFRLLGDNVFAFEEGNDRDFNDIVVKAQFQVI